MSRFDGAKWTALIDSFREMRSRLMSFYDEPDTSALDVEIARLRELRAEWIEQQKLRKAA